MFWDNFKTRLGLPSGAAIINFVVIQVVLELIWLGISQSFTIPFIREIGSLVVFIAGIFAVAWYLPKLMAVLLSGKTALSRDIVTTNLGHNKLQLVVNAIEEARQITPRGEDIVVCISSSNELKSLYPEEIDSILKKLQNEQKALIIKSFPEWSIKTDKEDKD